MNTKDRIRKIRELESFLGVPAGSTACDDAVHIGEHLPEPTACDDSRYIGAHPSGEHLIKGQYKQPDKDYEE